MDGAARLRGFIFPLVTHVSVVVAVYNGERTLERCLASLLAQTLTGHEVIVVDDASTDGTPQLLAAWRRRFPALRVIRLEENQGQRAAQYHGYRAAAGDYLSAVDADDHVGATRLESLFRLTVHAPIVVSGMTRQDAAGGLHPMRNTLLPPPQELREGLLPLEEYFPALYGEPLDKLLRRDLVLAGAERYRLFYGDDAWRRSANMPIFWALLKAGRIWHTAQADYFHVDTPGSASATLTPESAERKMTDVQRRYEFLSREFPGHRALIARKFIRFLEAGMRRKVETLLDADQQRGLEGRFREIRSVLEAGAR